MVNKSNYPLSAVNAVIRTVDLRDVAFITSAERESLNEINRYNPLRFNFVLKLAVRPAQSDRRSPPADVCITDPIRRIIVDE